jgi:hypothetical protein
MPPCEQLAIISPHSIASPVCAWEVDQVRIHGKRLAPIVISDVAGLKVPDQITKINYLFFNASSSDGNILIWNSKTGNTATAKYAKVDRSDIFEVGSTESIIRFTQDSNRLAVVSQRRGQHYFTVVDYTSADADSFDQLALPDGVRLVDTWFIAGSNKLAILTWSMLVLVDAERNALLHATPVKSDFGFDRCHHFSEDGRNVAFAYRKTVISFSPSRKHQFRWCLSTRPQGNRRKNLPTAPSCDARSCLRTAQSSPAHPKADSSC